ncbi:response regulator [Paenibacillus sp. sptzw28]|uniref:response regulator n=1 Tax=Paenibacillus sp. sptzw28 TaxID=715179 RepID=UPI001C6E1FF5|nr:response regulator [Paenibacillus sp. sptzw28]QYR20309.1 response regulator [Paenibacillus sp. sptzw28]
MDNLTMCVMDDIKAVVKGITSTILWSDYNIDIIGTASDGEEGLRLIREQKPNIVITDIRMPQLDGLEMIRRMTAEELPTKVIFMSGYTDFHYAQEAIRLGAFDYLLKPFTQPQILEAVMKVKQAIELEQSRSSRIMDLEKKMKKSTPYLRQDYIRNLLHYTVDTDSLEEQWQFLQIGMKLSPLMVMVIDIDFGAHQQPSTGEREMVRFAVQNIMEETLFAHTEGVMVREENSQLVVLFNPPPSIPLRELLEQCLKNVERYTRHTISIGVGTEIAHPRLVNESYQQAEKAIAYKFYSGGNSVIYFNGLRKLSSTAPRFKPDKEKELFYAIRCGNKSRTDEILDAIFLEWTLNPYPPEPDIMVNMFYGLAFAVCRMLSESIAEEERTELETSLAKVKENMSSTYYGWMYDVSEFCHRGCELMDSGLMKDNGQVITKAKEYIHEHLHTNFTVNECAKAVHLSPSYFANLFKKETGLTIAQYKTAKRIERAKELLIEGIQVQEIALMLGYEDRPYFSELFRKHSGMTPTSFRQLYMEEQGRDCTKTKADPSFSSVQVQGELAAD